MKFQKYSCGSFPSLKDSHKHDVKCQMFVNVFLICNDMFHPLTKASRGRSQLGATH